VFDRARALIDQMASRTDTAPLQALLLG
jgi:hypothetical protein